MHVDDEIDRFVESVNRGPRDRGDADEVPPSVAASGPDALGELDWQIRTTSSADRVRELEATLPAPLPPSYRSLVARYAFPAFEIPGAFLFASTPEGTPPHELRTRLQEPLARELMAARGLVQFASPTPHDYDAICFATAVRAGTKEYPVVRVDHEDVLLGRSAPRITPVAESFLALLREKR